MRLRKLALIVAMVSVLSLNPFMGGTLTVVHATSITDQAVTLINAERAKQGSPPLHVAPELAAAAQAYATEMATKGFFSHQGPDGSTMVSRDQAAGYTNWTVLEENLEAGNSTASGAVAAWMASSDHRQNILSTKVDETGVGFAVKSGSPYTYYWVEEFGARPAAQTQSAMLATNSSSASLSWTAPTGHTVSGDWLAWVRAHGDVDTVGLPRTNVIRDPATGQQVQYFQRMILEYHPENQGDQRFQRRLLGDSLYPGADSAVSQNSAPPQPFSYFPLSSNGAPTGLGHFVADYTRSGQYIGFKSFFDSHGGIAVLGFPKEEPKVRDGLWTQRFQAGVLQYNPNNPPGYRTQLELIGDEYIKAKGLGYN